MIVKSKRRIAMVAVVAVVVLLLPFIVNAAMLLINSFRYSESSIRPSEPNAVSGTSIDDFYRQTINWGDCSTQQISDGSSVPPSDPQNYQCATLYAPLDWDEPSGEQITLSIAVHRSGVEDAPALFYNLGGPGGAAVSSLVGQVESGLGDAVVKMYDIVALDPRGVGASSPAICMTDAQRDAYATNGTLGEGGTAGGGVSGRDMDPAEIIAQAEELSAKIAEGCQQLSGNVYKHIDTVSVAKDFDMVRAILGQEKLNYLGYSYGTFVGALYADMFADKVGRFVLDGAIDPAMDINQVSDLQMEGFEASARHWLEECVAGKNCPFSGSVDDAVADLVAFLDAVADQPLETSDPHRPLTRNLAVTGIITGLYSSDSYSVLTGAMRQAVEDSDGSQLLYIADLSSERQDDGTFASNSMDALIAVNNADYEPVGTPEEWTQAAEKLADTLPIFGTDAGYASAALSAWPTDHAARHPVSAKGAQPIVVVGTTHDPATPYVMAQNLAAQLESGVLVSVEGWSHTAYSKKASRCVVDAVEGYLVDGTVPANGLSCS